MVTKALYLEDTSLLKTETNCLSVASDERGQYGVFEATVFYPQGGGQPTDKGVVELNGLSIPIPFVARVDSEIRHYGDWSPVAGLSFPQPIVLKVDADERFRNARIHTAGHLVGDLVESLQPNLKGIKGYHFPDSPYVEFAGECNLEPAVLLETLNQRLAEELAKESRLEVVNSEIRMVTIAGFPASACAGTHLKSLRELTKVTATKFKKKAGNIRISYRHEP